MAVLLQIRDAFKSYGEQNLLDGAEATLIDDVKVGFVGRNGAGKSTLLRVLLGEEELDRGEVVRHPRLQMGFLRQHDPFNPGETAMEFLMRDSGQPDWKCGEVAGQFELKGAYLHGPLQELSGGWQTRVKLAALLLHEPNLLLLDEPTNFLDLRTQILLEHFLRGYQEACLIVSHDRTFLKATCTHTLDLSRGKLTMYPGPIDQFLQTAEEQRERDERTNSGVISKQKQLQRFIDKNRANANTASQARSKAKQLARLKLTETTSDEPTAFIRTPVIEPRRGFAFRCEGLAIGYPDHRVASDITVEIEHGDRAAIVGDNGQGKTTFLRTMVSSLEPQDGDMRWGFGCNVGTYAQHVYNSLPADRSVLDYLEYSAIPGTTTQAILKAAGSMLFQGAAVKKKISVLSGGERARLCMAGLLLGDFNVLVLDEPVNHLDVETVEALANALLEYKGTAIFTSHDRHFMQRIATCVIEVRDAKVRNYGGSYEAYVYAVNKEIEEGERQRGGGMSKVPDGKKPKSAQRVPQRDVHKIRKQLSRIEKTVGRLDQEKNAMSARLMAESDPNEALRLHNEVDQLQKKLAEAEQRWCELQEELESAS